MVLPYLGLLIIVLAPLALLLHRMPVVTLGVAAGLAVVSPLVMERSRGWVLAHPDAPAMVLDLVDWLAPARPTASCRSSRWRWAGSHSRRCSAGPRGSPARWLVGGALLVAEPRGLRPRRRVTRWRGRLLRHDRGDRRRDAPVAAARVVLSFAVLQTLRDLGAGRVADPVLATGRLALTAYTLQILWLALLSVLRDGAPDDEWWILGSSLVVVVGACWALDRWWGTGPLEWLVHRLRTPLTTASGRHAGPHDGA